MHLAIMVTYYMFKLRAKSPRYILNEGHRAMVKSCYVAQGYNSVFVTLLITNVYTYSDTSDDNCVFATLT